MNREALPLIAGIITPILIVALITTYLGGVDYLSILNRIPLIYYIVLVPFILGALAAAFYLRKNKE
jgi:predicted Na+-dependent transporter